MRLLHAFHSILARRPFATQAAFSTFTCTTGDLFAQYITGEQKWDKLRTARFAALGLFILTPPLNIWYRVLDRMKHRNIHILNIRRLMVDQLMFSPCFNVYILTSMRLLEGFSFKESIEKMKQDWYDVYTGSLSIWPILQLTNFYFIPLNYRIILTQTVAFFFNAWFSYRIETNNKKKVII